jgi:acyl dehydratase
VDNPIYYDDLTVGQVFMSRAEAIGRDRIVAFAQEFDPQPQHLDENAARGSMFGELVASGWHTAAITMRLQLESLMGRFPGGSLGAQVDKLAWVRPVRPGDLLRAKAEIMDMRPSRSRPDRGLVTIQTTTLNQRDEPVQVMTAAILAPRRPQDGTGPVS